jgi:hypothetical protein
VVKGNNGDSCPGSREATRDRKPADQRHNDKMHVQSPNVEEGE